MPRHDHKLCLKPAERLSLIVDILARLHYDFPRKDAKEIANDNIELFRNCGKQSALETAQAMIKETARRPEVELVIIRLLHVRVPDDIDGDKFEFAFGERAEGELKNGFTESADYVRDILMAPNDFMVDDDAVLAFLKTVDSMGKTRRATEYLFHRECPACPRQNRDDRTNLQSNGNIPSCA